MGRGLGVAVTVLFFFSCAVWAQTPTASVHLCGKGFSFSAIGVKHSVIFSVGWVGSD